MRISCNGCRVLRKGCSDDCCIRACLQWIPSAQSQANATLFLAKFYGRAGLVNLINSGPDNLRPAIFKSLLDEACGRIINPINGSVGLMNSGKWHLCEAAVQAVLSGASITPLPPESSSKAEDISRKVCDIRHVSKSKHAPMSSPSDRLHKVKSRRRLKRSASGPKAKPKAGLKGDCKWGDWCKKKVHELVSGDTDVSRLPSTVADDGDSWSVETVEASLAKTNEAADVSDVELELTLGLVGWS